MRVTLPTYTLYCDSNFYLIIHPHPFPSPRGHSMNFLPNVALFRRHSNVTFIPANQQIPAAQFKSINSTMKNQRTNTYTPVK
jgi:hypothetical protein